MMSIRRYAMLACLIPFPTLASDTQDPEIYAAIVSHRIEHSGAATAFSGSTDAFLGDLLVTPASPFSDLESEPSIVKSGWWKAMSEKLFPRAENPAAKALQALQTQMGVTKARPGVDYRVEPHVAALYRGAYPAAQAIKAGVDPDIFWQARTLNGSRFAEAAGEAVALQILRDQMKRNDASAYTAMAIRPEVLARYMSGQNPDYVSDEDRHYLGGVLRGALSSRLPSYASGGLPSGLPTIYRVARIAAAYSDAAGYANAPTCTAANLPIPEPGTPFCFAAATDRSVRSWYHREILWQEVRHPQAKEATALEKLAHLLSPVFFLLDGIALLELAEEAIASELLADEAIVEEEAALTAARAENITCRIRQ